MAGLCKRLILMHLLVAGSICCGLLASRAQEQLTTMRMDGSVDIAAVSTDGNNIAVIVGHSTQKEDGSWNSTEFLEVLRPSSSTVVAKIALAKRNASSRTCLRHRRTHL